MTHPAPSVNRRRALVLDVDGTLLDTVYLHVTAWWEAFEAAGEQVSCVDIHRTVGRGSTDLVEQLIGRSDDAIVQGHAQRWAPLRERCVPFHRSAELIRTVAGAGVQVVLCTSGSEQDTTAFRAKLGCDDVLAAVVSSADVAQSKPDPAIVRAALAAVDVEPDEAVMVGDTIYDVQAAGAAGVACIGVLCGGIGALELQEAGAVAVQANPAALLEDLAASPVGRLLDPRP